MCRESQTTCLGSNPASRTFWLCDLRLVTSWEACISFQSAVRESPQTWWLKPAERCCLTALEAEVQNQGVSRVLPPLRLSGENLLGSWEPPVLFTLQPSRVRLVFTCLLWASQTSLRFPSKDRTLSLDAGPSPRNQGDLISKPLITPARALFHRRDLEAPHGRISGRPQGAPFNTL